MNTSRHAWSPNSYCNAIVKAWKGWGPEGWRAIVLTSVEPDLMPADLPSIVEDKPLLGLEWCDCSSCLIGGLPVLLQNAADMRLATRQNCSRARPFDCGVAEGKRLVFVGGEQ